MTTKLTGCSDNIIELTGDLFTCDLYDEFDPSFDCDKGVIAFSDGSLIGFEYNRVGICRFNPIIKGTLFDRFEQETVDDDTLDVVHFKDGLKWAVLGEFDRYVHL